MTPPRLLRSLARLLPLFLLSLLLPLVALGQPAAPGPAELAPAARTRLAQAAQDTLLAPWQRDLMLRLARTGTTAAVDSSAADLRVARPARAAAAADGAWNQPVLNLARDSYGAIYDPVRDRIVVFGGYSDASPSPYVLNDVWSLSLAGTPAWTQLSPSGTPPSARWGHSAIYDPARDRMVVFGGYSSTYFNDVWALSLAGTPAWTQLTPSGTPPGARYLHSAIHDPVRDHMVVFGGSGGPSDLNDVWALSLAGTAVWTQLTPSGTPPSERAGHSAIHDPVRDRMVVLGGVSDTSSTYALNDVWSLSLAGTPAWTQLTPSGTPPSARGYHTAIYDPVRDRVVVFGGHDLGSYLNDVWALSLGGTPAWTQLIPSGTPPSPRDWHRAIYDPVRDRMVMFGGWSGFDLNDAWALSLAGTPTWTQVTPAGMPPSAREGHIAIHDPVRHRMVVFGGYTGSSYVNQVWTLSLAGTPAWTQLTPSGTPPSGRAGHSAIYDPVRDRVMVFAGYSSSGLNDVWALSLASTPTWTQLTPSGTPPSARYRPSAIYDPVRDRMVVFGGWSGTFINDVWALSLTGTPVWTQLTPSGTSPSVRVYHTAIYDPVRDRMVVFGGLSGSVLPGFSYLDDVWALSLAGTPAWTQLIPSGTSPSARYNPSAIYDLVRDRMVLFGGESESDLLNDVWELSLADTPAWAQLAPTGGPPIGRGAHSAIYDPVHDSMVMFGGMGSSTNLNDVWTLGWSFNTAVGDRPVRPLISYLRPPAPNPTRGATTVTYALARAGRVQLGVYDVSGRLVRRLVDGERRAGTETVVWNGTAESGARLQAGVYFVRLAAPGFRETRRVVLLK
jgi:predicted small integral membrane protein